MFIRELGREQTKSDNFLAASQLQYKVGIMLFPLCFHQQFFLSLSPNNTGVQDMEILDLMLWVFLIEIISSPPSLYRSKSYAVLVELLIMPNYKINFFLIVVMGHL